MFHQYCKPASTVKDFADIFKELIIDEKGDILPLAHGCSTALRIGNIQSEETFEEMVSRFMEEKMIAVMQLYETAYDEIINNKEVEIFNWSEIIIHKSHELPQPSRLAFQKR
jgi:hypothetical protein